MLIEFLRRVGRAGLLLACAGWMAGCVSLPTDVQRHESVAVTDTAGTPLARIADASLAQSAPDQSGFRILPTGDYAFDARLELAARAVKSIDAQYYQLHSDPVGYRFLRALRDAAARGVRVRVLLDDFYTTGQDGLLAEFASHPNVELRLFNPLPSRSESMARRLFASLHEFGRINHRMHNKLFVVDNTFSVTGGRNIGDEYFMSGNAAAKFIDLDLISCGPVVRQLSNSFDGYWNSRHSYPAESIVGRIDDKAAARARFDARTRAVEGVPWEVAPLDMFRRPSVGTQLAAGKLDLQFAYARLLIDTPNKVGSVRTVFAEGTAFFDAISLMRSARKEVMMASPYFIPGERGVELLREAVANGVRLNVLTNAADATDEPLVHFAYAKYRQEMLVAGVNIHELGGRLVTQSGELGAFGSSFGRLHAKVATVDRRWLIVGSMNLDGRSARANTEASVVVDSPALCGEILSLVERADHLAGSFKLRLTPDKNRIEWVSREGDREVVTRDEPGATMLSRAWLWLLSKFVDEELL